MRKIDAIFDIEREINGLSIEDRRAARRLKSAPLVAALEKWMRAERAKLSRHNAVAKAIDYMLTRWPAFARFLDDGRICLTNNAAERALRGLALGRKSWLFAGSERGAERAAIMYTLIQTVKLNDVDPHGAESRLTSLQLKDLEEEARVPACGFSAGFDASLGFVGADEAEGEAANDGHVLGAVS